VYQTVEKFGYNDNGTNITADRSAYEATLWNTYNMKLGGGSSCPKGAKEISGWSLNLHHTYDPVGKVLYLGDGSKRSAENLSAIITTVAGTVLYGFSGDGGPATQAELNGPYGVAIGPDGSIYIADSCNHRIRKVNSDGIITTIAGTGEKGYNGDDGLATQAEFNYPYGVAIGSDGSIYIADSYNSHFAPQKPTIR